jgi:hypothetical protein
VPRKTETEVGASEEAEDSNMGIKGLTKLLADNAPGAMKEQKFESYFGRRIAIDASMSIYQFLIVVGRTGNEMLTNEAGEVTSHLQGMFNRTIRVLEAGMKPVYVPLCEQLLYPVPTCNDNDTRGGIRFVCYIFCLYLFEGEACVRLETCQILVCVCLFQICV